MNSNGIRYKEARAKYGRKYILDECPFNSSHKAPDSFVSVADNGAIAFHCSHNSCADKKWRDLRLLYDPEAYSRTSYVSDVRLVRRIESREMPEPNRQGMRDITEIEFEDKSKALTIKSGL